MPKKIITNLEKAKNVKKVNIPSRLTHGAQSKILWGGRVDQRTGLGKAMKGLRRSLISEMGGDDNLTTQQRILIDRIVQKTFQAHACEAEIMEGNRGPEGFYLALTNSLRHDLTALGLNRIAKDIPTLKDYLVTITDAKKEDSE